MTPVFIDTSYIVALLSSRDEQHTLATDLARRYIGTPLVTTDAVLYEIGNTLTRRLRNEAVRAIDNFLIAEDTEVVYADQQLLNRAINLGPTFYDLAYSRCVPFLTMLPASLALRLPSTDH